MSAQAKPKISPGYRRDMICHINRSYSRQGANRLNLSRNFMRFIQSREEIVPNLDHGP